MMGDRLGFIQKDGTWGDPTPEHAKQFLLFAEAVQAATLAQALHPDICQIRLIRADFVEL